MKEIKRIAVFTSGGDAPGMNACIRAVVRTALFNKLQVYGIMRGYQGMLEGEMKPMTARSVSNILQRGGTILKTARSKDFMTEMGMKRAYENLKQLQIDAIVAIGGDGTFKGATEFLSKYPDLQIIGIPGTIDNDLAGTDFTLGFDTAVNTTIEAIDKIKDTAASHDRCFFVEVMGRDSGCIALWAGVAGGAEAILLPERPSDIDGLIKRLEYGAANNKSSNIIVVAEGEKNGGAANIARQVKERLPNYDTKVTILGHVQRGGSPTAFDRLIAAQFGAKAVELILQGENKLMVGISKNIISTVPFSQAIKSENPLDENLLRIAGMLAL